MERAQDAAHLARAKGVVVSIHVAITGVKAGEAGVSFISPQLPRSDPDAIQPVRKNGGCCCAPSEKDVDGETSSETPDESRTSPELIREYNCRPDIESLIRGPVEQAWGETAVIVCGGKEIVARTRNSVSRLSDERAVHKGTGAQGIFLHVEEYSF